MTSASDPEHSTRPKTSCSMMGHREPATAAERAPIPSRHAASPCPAAAPQREVSAATLQATHFRSRRQRVELGGCRPGRRSRLARGVGHLVLLLRPGPARPQSPWGSQCHCDAQSLVAERRMAASLPLSTSMIDRVKAQKKVTPKMCNLVEP